MTIETYLNLITSQHRDKPKFVATVQATVSPLVALQGTLKGLVQDYDLDTAIGQQLDIIGQWAGITRNLNTPLAGVYLTWDSSLDSEGWEQGTWQGEFDPASGLTRLPDDSFRTLLKAKIAANNWDGTIEKAYDIWASVFTDSFVVIQDNQNMSMVVAISGHPLDAIERALLEQGYLPLKPAGVRVNYYAIAPSEGKLLGWDCDNAALGGWDSAQWAFEVSAL